MSGTGHFCSGISKRFQSFLSFQILDMCFFSMLLNILLIFVMKKSTTEVFAEYNKTNMTKHVGLTGRDGRAVADHICLDVIKISLLLFQTDKIDGWVVTGQ